MKYLKSYNESRFSYEYFMDLKDILLELRESGFNIEFKYPYADECVKIIIFRKIDNRVKYFPYDEVIEYVERIKDFCKINNLDFLISKGTDQKYTKFSKRKSYEWIESHLDKVEIIVKNKED